MLERLSNALKDIDENLFDEFKNFYEENILLEFEFKCKMLKFPMSQLSLSKVI